MARPVIGVCVIWLGLLACATHLRAQVWTSDGTLWEDAIQQAPLKPRPWINVGLAREQRGDWPGALAAYQTALALAPQPRLSPYQQRFSHVASLTNIARVLAQTGHEPEAEQLLRQLVEQYPRFPHVNFNLAVLLAKTGRCEAGQRYGDLARQLEPAFPAYQCP